jgi:hypothetical protein
MPTASEVLGPAKQNAKKLWMRGVNAEPARQGLKPNPHSRGTYGPAEAVPCYKAAYKVFPQPVKAVPLFQGCLSSNLPA